MARIIFAASPTGSATAASQAKFGVTQPAIVLLLTAGSLKTLTNATFRDVVRFPDKDNLRFMLYRDVTTIRAYIARTSQGFSSIIATMSTSGLADTDLVAVMMRYVTGTSNPTPDLYAAFTKVSDGSSLGSGSVRLGGASLTSAASSIEVWNIPNAGDLAGLGIFNGTPASNYLEPSADPALLALYYMDDDGTGKLKDSVSGGTALTVTNGTFDTTADDWDASAPATDVRRPTFLRAVRRVLQRYAPTRIWTGAVKVEVALPADYYTPRNPTVTIGPTLSPTVTVGPTLNPTVTITH